MTKITVLELRDVAYCSDVLAQLPDMNKLPLSIPDEGVFHKQYAGRMFDFPLALNGVIVHPIRGGFFFKRRKKKKIKSAINWEKQWKPPRTCILEARVVAKEVREGISIFTLRLPEYTILLEVSREEFTLYNIGEVVKVMANSLSFERTFGTKVRDLFSAPSGYYEARRLLLGIHPPKTPVWKVQKRTISELKQEINKHVIKLNYLQERDRVSIHIRKESPKGAYGLIVARWNGGKAQNPDTSKDVNRRFNSLEALVSYLDKQSILKKEMWILNRRTSTDRLSRASMEDASR